FSLCVAPHPDPLLISGMVFTEPQVGLGGNGEKRAIATKRAATVLCSATIWMGSVRQSGW
ncbi:MAG: hypothetical protein K2X46_06390, partial [Roseomonas sp.]|nr:hypothetical protein [Roseomonas sp.]